MPAHATGCEGGCGSRLTPDGHERGIVAPGPQDYSPRHTPQRCRAIRTLRRAIEQRVPDVAIDIEPMRKSPDTLAVYVSREVGDQLYSVTRALREQQVIDSPSASLFAEHEAELIARQPLG